MALQNKCEVFLKNNELVIYDTSGFYSFSNPSGWSHPSGAGGNATIIDSNLVGTIDTITLIIDGITVSISSGINEASLPTSFSYLTSPGDLIFTINPSTYPTFQADFGGFSDGLHSITYIIQFTLGSGFDDVSFTTQFFTYKDVEALVWAKFHTIAYDHNNMRVNDEFVTQALFAQALLKGLEYSARTSTNVTKSLEILATLTKILDFNNCKSK